MDYNWGQHKRLVDIGSKAVLPVMPCRHQRFNHALQLMSDPCPKHQLAGPNPRDAVPSLSPRQGRPIRDQRRVVDCQPACSDIALTFAGAHGSFLARIMHAVPSVQGVLVDQPQVTADDSQMYLVPGQESL